ncbi:MAG: site-2 protease family protein [Anaerolineae bacterium]|nr:site-2 protease family protein [Anaerolineae bacterium]
MRSGFSMGRIFGIRVRIDWSWLLIFAFSSWNLAARFGQWHQDWGDLLRWGVAVGAALLFFGSVLAHELAHSLVARSHGVPVRGITLFLFGGVSNIQRDPDAPGREFTMAVVGPLTSLAIGLVLLLIAGTQVGPMGRAMAQPQQMLAELSPWATLLLWLGSINIMVGLFNLIPAFPLDGGRILRSIFWAISDNLRSATRWASGIGQLVAWIMILAGISSFFGASIPFFGAGFANGLWLIFLGWFLNNAASSSYRRVVIQDVLEDVPVERMMRRDPPTVSPDIRVSELVNEHIMGRDDHAFFVVQGKQIQGIVTLEDVRNAGRDRWDTLSVRDIMTRGEDLVTVSAEEDASDAFDKLTQRDVQQLPVLSDGQLVGCVHRRDIIRWLRFSAELT